MRNLNRLTHKASTLQARIDWNNLAKLAGRHDFADIPEKHRVPADASFKVIDNATEVMIKDLSEASGVSENYFREYLGWVPA